MNYRCHRNQHFGTIGDTLQQCHPPKVGEREVSSVRLGEEVWVKPVHARMSHCIKGVVTGINSQNNVSVDGMPQTYS